MKLEKQILTHPLYGRIARISRPKLNAIGMHEGVQTLDGQVAHTSWGQNTEVCSFNEFASGFPVTLEYLVPRTLNTDSLNTLNEEIRSNAEYNLLSYNCEIFARRVVLQKSESPQVNFWVMFLAITGIWYASVPS